MKANAPLTIYGSIMVVSVLLSWFGGDFLCWLITPPALGACLAALLAALFFGELKQESIGQLYQALATSSLKSAEQAVFADQALSKVRTIRRLFFCSSAVKAVGAVGAVYLVNEKAAEWTVQVDVSRIVILMCLISMVLFARLWLEVADAERVLLGVKMETLLKERREKLVEMIDQAPPHDFDTDEAARSFESEPSAIPWKKLTKLQT